MDIRLKKFIIGNGGVWPKSNEVMPSVAFVGGCPNFWVGIEEFLEARAELENKPSWGDAPEWANWLAQDSTGIWVWYSAKPMRVEGAGVWARADRGEDNNFMLEVAGCGYEFGTWRYAIEERPENRFHECTSMLSLLRRKKAESMMHIHPASKEAGWQPIETAPKGRKSYLVWVPDKLCQFCVRWDESIESWQIFGGCQPLIHEPTHWMPLPEPPESGVDE